jgi:hypothetical protein
MGKGNDPNCGSALSTPMVTPEAEAPTLVVEAAPAAPAAGGQDPVLEKLVVALRDGVSDDKEKDRLRYAGLLIRLPAPAGRYGYGGRAASRYVPTTLGQIIVDKGRLPTPTETKRAIKTLDAQLKRAGVTGDVATGSFSYQEPTSPSAQSEQQRLIRDRQSIKAFATARRDGQFEAVKLRNAGARAAQAQLAAWLDELAAARSYQSDLSVQAAKVRSGQLSISEAAKAISSTGHTFNDTPEAAARREAITIGLGLPSSREKRIKEHDRSTAAMRRSLDRIYAGEKLTSDGGEIVWSRQGISDGRVSRAAFGYCEAAARIQADYHQAALIELHDGTVQQVTVKRAHHDLENYVDDVVHAGVMHQESLQRDAAIEAAGQKLLRRWARTGS